MLNSCGLVVEECYTTAWRESKYTLIRLDKSHSVRRASVVKIMQDLHDHHGIIGTEIFGFEMVSSNTQAGDDNLFDHPGFRLIVEAMNKDISRLESWLREGEVLTNRKGLLWKHIEGTDPELMTKAQLMHRAKEYEALKKAHASVVAKLSSTEAAYREERKLNKEFMDMLISKINECGELKRELSRLHPRQSE